MKRALLLLALVFPALAQFTPPVDGGGGTCASLGGDVTGNCAANVVSTISTASIALPGNPTTSTQTAGNNSTRIATTAFVSGALGSYLPLAGGTMTGNILFTDNLYDIGASGATRPRNLYLSALMTSVSAKVTGLGGGGTQCVTADNTGALGVSGANCVNGTAQGTISGTSIAITHTSSTVLSFACFTSGGVWVEPNTVTQTSATVLTLTFISDQTGGTCNVFTNGGATSGITAISVTAPITSTGGNSPTIAINAFGGDSGSGGTKGAVPAPAAGDAAAGKYLKADGTWAVGTGSGTSTILIVTGHGNHTTSAAISTEFFSSCDATSGNVTLSLPASPTTGELHNVKRKDASGNLCLIDGNGKTIDGGSSVPMATQYLGISVYYDGTQWWVI
ncbi:MAG: hypothetical protein V4502_08075 [Pseudomonadota bacterium]